MLIISMLMFAAQAAPPSQTATNAPVDKVMCRMIQEAFSRIPSRICRKQSEWDRYEKETQDELRSSRHQRSGGGMDKTD